MREAVFALADDRDRSDGGEQFMARLATAGLDEIRTMYCDGQRCVLHVRVANELDREELAAIDVVEEVECLTERGPGSEYLLEYDLTSEPCGIDPGDTSGQPLDHDDGALERPLSWTVDADEDGATVALTGSQAAIGETIAELEDAGIDVDLRSLRAYETSERPLDALTDRQRETLRVAYEAGYFDVPRDASMADVAAELDLDSSTVSEHLQRAERNLLSALFSR